MKFTLIKIYFLLVILILFSCNHSDEKNQLIDYTYPENAIIEKYEHFEGLEKVIIKNSNGQIVAEGDYLNGLKHGPWTEFDDEKGFIKLLKTYDKGNLHGISLEFERNRLIAKKYYKNNQLHGLSLVYSLNFIVEEKNYIEGKIEGTVKKYYDDGKIMEKAPYSNGVIDGLAKWYDLNGNVTIQYLYEKGKLIDKNPTIIDVSK